MKKRYLEKRLRRIAAKAGYELVYTPGSNHDKYFVNGVMLTVPRHTEVKEFTAKEIIKKCERAVAKGDKGTL